MPSNGARTDEPIIPPIWNCQVETTEVTVTQEMVTPVTEEEEPVGLPSIDTRTVKTQRGNYATINTRVFGSVGKVGGDRTGSDQAHTGGLPTKTSLGTSRNPWHGGKWS